MSNIKNINEGEQIKTDAETYAKLKGKLSNTTTVTITGDKPAPEPVTEDESAIEPKDKSTIKYLSNTKDPNTGKVSEPFSIEGKRYQMVRGISNKEKVMAVYCHDELNEAGENIIHPIDHFEKTIANPSKERAAIAEEEEANTRKAISYKDDKHFLVNREKGGIRSFKSIKELVMTRKLDEEDYMGVKEFKQHMNEKLFGSRKRPEIMSEEAPVEDENNDEQMNVKAKKLMALISRKIPSAVIDSIKSPIAKREVIAAFSELIGVPRNGLQSLISGLKELSRANEVPAPAVAESKVITKNSLLESLGAPKNKIVKIKDIR
jgi:hypothetical protein